MYPENKVNKISAQLEKLKTIFKGDYQISQTPSHENGKTIYRDVDIWYLCEEEGEADKIDYLFEIFKELNKGLGKKGIKLVFFEPATGQKKCRCKGVKGTPEIKRVSMIKKVKAIVKEVELKTLRNKNARN